MTHDTPPKRIWAEKTGKWWLGGSVVHCAEYTLTSEVDALVAAALREAAKVTDRYIVPSLTPIMQISEIRLGQDAAAQKIQERILALIPQPAAAALDKLIAEAEARGMEKAAEICEGVRTGIANGPMPEGARFDYEQAIRAAKGDTT